MPGLLEYLYGFVQFAKFILKCYLAQQFIMT